MIDPATGWFEIVEIPTYELDEVMACNDEYTYKSFSRVSQFFNNTWLCIYPRPQKFVFDNGYDLKRDFTPFIKDFNIKPVLIPVKNHQANAPVERVHQVILNILVTKDIDNKVFDHIYIWGETLAYISWPIRTSYHRTIMATPFQYVFGRDMLFKLTPVVDWRVVTAARQRQVDIDNDRENARRATHDYTIGDRVYL